MITVFLKKMFGGSEEEFPAPVSMPASRPAPTPPPVSTVKPVETAPPKPAVTASQPASLKMPAEPQGINPVSKAAPPPSDRLILPLMAIADRLPEQVKGILMGIDLSKIMLRLPLAEIEPMIVKGRMIVEWRRLRTWVDRVLPVPADFDAPIDLPLSVIVPLFLAAKKPAPGGKWIACDSNIPDLFVKGPSVSVPDYRQPEPKPAIPEALRMPAAEPPTPLPHPPAPMPDPARAESAIPAAELAFFSKSGNQPEPAIPEPPRIPAAESPIPLPHQPAPASEPARVESRISEPEQATVLENGDHPEPKPALAEPLRIAPAESPIALPHQPAPMPEPARVESTVSEPEAEADEVYVLDDIPEVEEVAAPVRSVPEAISPKSEPSPDAVAAAPKPAREAGLSGGPWEIVSRACILEGVNGAFIGTKDGLFVAGQTRGMDERVLTAFAPGLFAKFDAYAQLSKFGQPESVRVNLPDAVLQVFRCGELYFGVIGSAGAPLPLPELGGLAARLQTQKT